MSTSQTRTIKATEFTAKCRTLIDEVAATGEEIIVTQQGKPVGKFVPVEQPRRPLWGLLASDIEIIGDIVSPIDVETDADTEPKRPANA
ncbi:MAG: type II toxin-antitoxin system Phd/YefM family antitoxin [Caldilineaceae bacterium]|nr:type II toxin-antitoxin system Phd/YefM family antitoxin [Caldilineaceae bacterium]